MGSKNSKVYHGKPEASTTIKQYGSRHSPSGKSSRHSPSGKSGRAVEINISSKLKKKKSNSGKLKNNKELSRHSYPNTPLKLKNSVTTSPDVCAKADIESVLLPENEANSNHVKLADIESVLLPENESNSNHVKLGPSLSDSHILPIQEGKASKEFETISEPNVIRKPHEVHRIPSFIKLTPSTSGQFTRTIEINPSRPNSVNMVLSTSKEEKELVPDINPITKEHVFTSEFLINLEVSLISKDDRLSPTQIRIAASESHIPTKVRISPIVTNSDKSDKYYDSPFLNEVPMLLSSIPSNDYSSRVHEAEIHDISELDKKVSLNLPNKINSFHLHPNFNSDSNTKVNTTNNRSLVEQSSVCHDQKETNFVENKEKVSNDDKATENRNICDVLRSIKITIVEKLEKIVLKHKEVKENIPSISLVTEENNKSVEIAEIAETANEDIEKKNHFDLQHISRDFLIDLKHFLNELHPPLNKLENLIANLLNRHEFPPTDLSPINGSIINTIAKEDLHSLIEMINSVNMSIPIKIIRNDNRGNEVIVFTSLVHIASLLRRPKSLSFFLQKGGDPNGFDSNGQTPIQNLMNDSVLVKQIHQSNETTNVINVFLINECKASRNLLKCLNYLVEYGADLNIVDRNGRTPLLNAGCKGNTTLMAALIRKGADIRKQDTMGKNAIHCICDTPYDEESVSHIIQDLNAKGLDINLQDELGNTPLHYATKWENKSIINTLFKLGADPWCINMFKQHPFL